MPEDFGYNYYVYFIKENDVKDPFYKIGYTKNLKQRKQQLQTGHPRRLAYFGLIGCKCLSTAKRKEIQLHGRYRKHREHGEWFRWNDDIQKVLNGEQKFEDYIRYFS